MKFKRTLTAIALAACMYGCGKPDIQEYAAVMEQTQGSEQHLSQEYKARCALALDASQILDYIPEHKRQEIARACFNSLSANDKLSIAETVLRQKGSGILQRIRDRVSGVYTAGGSPEPVPVSEEDVSKSYAEIKKILGCK